QPWFNNCSKTCSRFGFMSRCAVGSLTQLSAPIPSQRIQEDLLAFTAGLIPAVHASAALGQAYARPVGGSITGPAITTAVHQGFQQDRFHRILGRPIPCQ